MSKIAIIGAGYAGMVAAWDLRKAGHDVTIYESADFVGGLASGFKEPGWKWSVEKFYHHWFGSDSHMLGIIDELGLKEKVLFPRPLTVMFHEGKFYPFDSIINALLFPGLGWGINKLRFGLVGLFLRITTNWQELEKHTVDEWMRKWAGEKVYKLMWEPLLIGKFSEKYYKQVNMAWLWARLHARTTRLGTYEGGFQAFANDFAEKLREKGVEIKLGSAVTHIKRNDSTGLVELETDAGTETAEKVLVTLAPNVSARMIPSLPKEYLEGLLRLKHMGAVVMVLSLKNQLSKEGYYWYNIPKSAGFPFLAVVEHTNFVSSENFGGDHIVYVGDYLDQDHEHFRLDRDALLERFAPSLKKFNPDFDMSWVKKSWLFRTTYAQPVPMVNHSKNIPAIETPIPGIYLASMSQVYPWDRGTNFAIEIGRNAAKLMMKK